MGCKTQKHAENINPIESTKHVGRDGLMIQLASTCNNTRMQLVSGLASARYLEKGWNSLCVILTTNSSTLVAHMAHKYHCVYNVRII